MKKIIFALPLLTITATCSAMNHGLYLSPGVGLQNLLPKINITNIDEDDISTTKFDKGESDVFGSLALGYNLLLNNRFTIGIQADGRFANTEATIKSTNLDLEDDELNTLNIATKFKHGYGISLRPGVLLNENTNGFILAGYRHTKLNYAYNISDNANLSKNLSHNGFEYGLGTEISLNKQLSLRIEASQTHYKSKNIFNNEDGKFSAKTKINQGMISLLWYPQLETPQLETGGK